MKIGIPKEIKIKENRVACTPAGCHTLTAAGHEVCVETNAGVGAGFTDSQFRDCGALIVASAAETWSADMVMKVKEPLQEEHSFLREGLILFTYLHLAANRELTQALLDSGTTAIAYETIQVGRRLPILEPMSEIAGRMSALAGAWHLSRAQGGSGTLLCGVPGVLPGNVLVIGGGTAGTNAARVALGLGANVTIMDVNLEKMRALDTSFGGSVKTLFSNEQNLLEILPNIDLLIGAVLLPGKRAPHLIRKEMLQRMKPGSVFVDIAIDQGGCAETSHPTTHDDPVYTVDGVVHYCVANMPGAYALTATQALTNASIPYALKIANLGFPEVCRKRPELIPGVNICEGAVTYQPVAEAHGMTYMPLQ